MASDILMNSDPAVSCMSCMDRIKMCIIEHMSRIVGLASEDQIRVTKRNRKLNDGDFIVHIAPKHGMSKLKLGKDKIENIEISQGKHVITARVTKVVEEKGFSIFVKLDRKSIANYVIDEVLTKSISYGDNSPEMSKCVPVLLTGLIRNGKNTTMHDLRTLILTEHIENLLQVNGYKTVKIQKLPECLTGLVKHNVETLPKELTEKVHCNIHEILNLPSKYISKEMRQMRPVSSVHQAKSVPEEKTLGVNVLDLDTFVKDNGLQNYGVTHKTVDISPEDDLLKSVCEYECWKKLYFQSNNVELINVVPNSFAFKWRLQNLAWMLITDNIIKSTFVEVAPVSAQNSASDVEMLPITKYLLTRKDQAKHAFKMKYGDINNDSKWEHYIEVLSQAAVKFEILATSYSSALKLDLNRETLDTKGGVFILYNYARLSTLFANFDKSVKQEVYPALPPLNEVDFTLLKEEEEWELIFNFILKYPSTVNETVNKLKIKESKLPILTHKICQFLHDLCLSFSSYYNRVHILCEPYPHLLPQLYARLYLMKAVQQVFFNGLHLLNIKPLDEL